MLVKKIKKQVENPLPAHSEQSITLRDLPSQDTHKQTHTNTKTQDTKPLFPIIPSSQHTQTYLSYCEFLLWLFSPPPGRLPRNYTSQCLTYTHGYLLTRPPCTGVL